MAIKSVISKSEYILNQFITEYLPATQNGHPLDAKGTFFIFHGFPSWRTKNYDIAEILALRGFQVFVFHQIGLGLSQGTFEFKKSKDLIEKTIETLKPRIQSPRTYFVGHSWGGFLSILLSKFCTQAMYLIAPLSFMPEKFNGNYEDFGEWVYSIDPEDYGTTYSASDISTEFEEMYQTWNQSRVSEAFASTSRRTGLTGPYPAPRIS